MAPSIEVHQLSKRYLLGEHIGGRRTLVSHLRSRRSPGLRELWALRDVNLVIDQGETVGLMGRNGSGKSTMLRVIAGVTAPTEGWSRTRGHVGSLLEVGAGFYDELSGRDNIYLNAALLGRRPADVARRFDDIVEFSGIAHMLDTPTRRYSSGQFMRLAFAVAAHLESEIMLVDEVLAVGDREFQQVARRKLIELARSGTTVVFVSHHGELVSELCQRSVWLDRGTVQADGPTAGVLARYEQAQRVNESDPPSLGGSDGAEWTERPGEITRP